MGQLMATAVSKECGWQKSADGKNARISFHDMAGKEIAVTLGADAVSNLLHVLLDATAITPRLQALEFKQRQTFSTNWHEIGNYPDSADVALTLHRPGGGHITFRIPRDMAEKLLQSLKTALHGAGVGTRRGS
jgi:hypothetical protein